MDEQIKKDIVDQLYWDTRVNASEVTVEVEAGVARLGGIVDSVVARRAAYDDASHVAGVVDVQDEMEVRLPESLLVPTDDEIEANAKNVLEWSASVDASDIDVDVTNGQVVLRGTVKTYWEKVDAEFLVSPLKGVLAVHNELTVVVTEDLMDEQIAEQVMAAIRRSPIIDPDNVNVEVADGRVTLNGTVPSWAALAAAGTAARRTLGVREVNNKMVVRPAAYSPAT